MAMLALTGSGGAFGNQDDQVSEGYRSSSYFGSHFAPVGPFSNSDVIFLLLSG